MMIMMNQSQQQQQQQQPKQPASLNKAQKGWLSRWTRKQWSRHWFVLQRGSITYYRGPAAELCSFLDGVLDLSLIKAIDVSEPPAQPGPGVGSHQAGSAQANQQQFTFTLRMWNGECHQLGAPSEPERQLWLQAINLSMNGHDEASSTDSSDSSSSSFGKASSASSTTGLVQLRRHYEQQLSHDQLALSLKTALNKRREQELQGSLATRHQQQEACEPVAPASNSLEQPAAEQPAAGRGQPEVAEEPGAKELAASEQSHSWQQSQAFKRRLLCLQARQADRMQLGEPQLVSRRFAKLSSSSDSSSSSSSESSSPSSSEASSEDELELDSSQARRGGQPTSMVLEMEGPSGSGEVAPVKQKKRVTFDLSKCSHHQLSAEPSSAESSSASGDDSDEPQDSDDSTQSSSQSALAAERQLAEEAAASGPEVEAPPPSPPAVAAARELHSQPAEEHAMDTSGPGSADLPVESETEPEGKTDTQLAPERGASRASFRELEQNYKRLEGEMSKCDERHQAELGRLEARVEELTRELARSERQLLEARQKLARLLEAEAARENSQAPEAEAEALLRRPAARPAGNWLKAKNQQQQQQQVASKQPLLLSMQQARNQMALDQKAISLKLLNHSKQIQRKLNELELKVDKIHESSSPLAPAGRANKPSAKAKSETRQDDEQTLATDAM